MAQVLETRPGTLPEYDHKGAVRARRSFLVDIRPGAVPKDGTLVGLPGANAVHPDLPTARVDAIIPGPLEGRKDWSLVEVLYSSDRQFEFPTPPLDPAGSGFSSWSMSFEKVVQDIAIARRIRRTIPQPLGGAPVSQASWAFGPQEVLSVKETRVIFYYRLNLDLSLSFPSVPSWDLIAAQNDKIHTFGTRKYLFEAGQISQITSTLWEVNYSWMFDGGTARTASVINPNPVHFASIIYPPGSPTVVGGLIRDPFKQWITVDDTTGTNPTGYPDFFPISTNEEAPTGWQTLPGLS